MVRCLLGKVIKIFEFLLRYFLSGNVMQKNISKTMYSEWVIRNSLYWMSGVTRWKLDEDDEHWLVSFDDWNDGAEFEFERLLNDYKLREKVQAHTSQVRTSIIDNVLRSIDSRLSQ
ncbi:His-Xaa-Ser system protein HxsD [Pantoea ananatis]|nr:His-Xaa-Ser system protein HxsD [Pantoea ananatis]MDR6092560.1 His-Xaa-Ser system protein HxsD [Pantoea ananatis]